MGINDFVADQPFQLITDNKKNLWSCLEVEMLMDVVML